MAQVVLLSAPTLEKTASLPTKYIVSSFSKYGKNVYFKLGIGTQKQNEKKPLEIALKA
jgi:hypothetical protein